MAPENKDINVENAGIVGENVSLEGENVAGRDIVSHIKQQVNNYYSASPVDEANPSKTNISQVEFLKPVSRLDKISCNRVDALRVFKSAFRKKSEESCHFYFIQGEPDQSPRSLSERFIFEILAERGAVPVHFFKKGSDNIQDDIFPQGQDLEDSRIELLDFFNRKFSNAVLSKETEISSLADLEKSHHPMFESKYVAMVFKITNPERDWKEFTQEHIRWFIQSFCNVSKTFNTQFVFFFLIYPTQTTTDKKGFLGRITSLFGGSKLSDKSIRKELETLASEQTNVTLLPELLPVPKSELLEWFDKFINDKDRYEIERIVQQTLEKELDKMNETDRKRICDKDGRLNMAFIEYLLHSIVEINQLKIPNPNAS